MRSLPFLFKEALVNLRRHGLMTVAAITTIAVALSLIGSFLLTFYQINVATTRTVGDFEMRVFCQQSVKKAQIPKLQALIAGLPGVGSVRYVSKEEAFKEGTKNQAIDLAGMPNLFNEEFVVKLNDPRRASSVAAKIGGWKNNIQEVALPEDELNDVLRIANVVRNIGVIGGAILLMGALLVVSNTVRISLFARRREIKIMQIVGVSGWFIRLPLLLEGLIHGLTGGLLAAVAVALIGRNVEAQIRLHLAMIARYFQPVDLLRFGAAVVGVGVLIGAFGSLLSMRRYLKAV